LTFWFKFCNNEEYWVRDYSLEAFLKKAIYKKTKHGTKKKLPIWTIIVILTLVLAACVAVAFHNTEVIDSDGSENPISILFVGNSHVFVGDVPGQLQTLSRANGIEIVYRDISRHGASLSDSKENAIIEMQNRRFNYVVLQDRNIRPLNDTEGFLEDIRFLSDAARENGAIPVLYNPAWANTNGQPYEERQKIFTEVYKRAAYENNGILVNADDAWIYAYKTIPGISLYSRFDLRGPHANNAGAFLTACVFTATLFNLHIEAIPQNNRYRGRDAIALAQAAWEFVHPSP